MNRIFSPYLLDAGERFMEIILMKVVLGIHFMKEMQVKPLTPKA